MLASITIGVVLIWILFLVIVLGSQLEKAKNHKEQQEPFVSILIALRNEEENVRALCDSLMKLTYPSSKFEILLGDDDSDDSTLEYLEKHKPENASVLSLHHRDGSFGKQKVLSQLAKQAKGDFLLLTDADMQFHPDWIQGMLSGVFDKREIVVGLTKVTESGWLSSLQNIDWLFNEWIIGWFARMGVGLTAWGNNLLIPKSTYDEIGGHEGLKQSIVEDITLLKAVLSNGGKLVVNFNTSAVASTKPATFLELLHQRKRWMKGLLDLNPLVWLGGLIKWLFWPALIHLTFDNPFWIMLGITVIVLKLKIASQIEKVTDSRFSIVHLLLFEIYDFVFYLITFAFCLMPIKLVWKGRKY
ncbi:glycosyltransferase [Reichenbachiella sp.]|uniref:glycosyltransferase n=1 Tax=Reichenbachiella sp. TaxID=2184521 RepID=UPI003BB122C6